MKDKYHELDKSVSKQIMKEFKGTTTNVVCPDCKGKGYFEFGNPETGQINSVVLCEGCKGQKSVDYEW